jgi:hypothetical protein
MGKRKVKLSLCLTKDNAMKIHGGMEVQIHVFLTSDLLGGEPSASSSCHFTPGERFLGTPWTEGRVDPRAGTGNMEKL